MPLARAALVAIAVASVSGCTGWRRTAQGDLYDGTALRDRAQVWVGGRAHDLHGFRVSSDTLYGVPYFMPPSCDSCAVALARAEIDSVRVRQSAPGRNVGLVAIGLAVLLIYGLSQIAVGGFPGAL